MKKFQTYSFPLKLKMLRLEAGKSQEEFSSELGISRSCLANYETGKRQPSGEMISKIANLCNIMPSFLTEQAPYQDTILQESEGRTIKKLRARATSGDTKLDISHLKIEDRISMIEYYDYVLHKQKENPGGRVFRFR